MRLSSDEVIWGILWLLPISGYAMIIKFYYEHLGLIPAVVVTLLVPAFIGISSYCKGGRNG